MNVFGVGGRFLRSVGLLAISLSLLTACVSTPSKSTDTAGKNKFRLLWPAPPDQPRFAFQTQLNSVADIVRESDEKRMERMLTGQAVNDKPVIEKPSGIVARGGRVYVAEPAAKGVTVFDVPRRKIFRFGQREPNNLEKPQSIAIDEQGRVYVLDSKLRRVMVFDGLGLFDYSIAVDRGFTNPVAVAVSADGQTVYVVDRGDVATDDHKVVAFSPDGKERFRLGPRGSAEGRFNIPLAAGTGPDGSLYVVDSGNFRVQVFDADGKFRSSFGGLGSEIGKFSRPRAIALDREGNVYVADAAFNNIQIFDPKGQLLMPLGMLSREAGPGHYSLLAGITVDERGFLYVVDHYFKKIEVFRRLSDEEGRKLIPVK